jgi:hypothetical protein
VILSNQGGRQLDAAVAPLEVLAESRARMKDFKATVRTTFDGQLPEKTDAEAKKWLKTRAEGQDPKMALALMRDLFG